MRTLEKNKQKMKYALQITKIPIYVTDEDGNIIYDSYTDSDGNEIPYLDENGNKIPLDSGEKEIVYSTPKDFKANISERLTIKSQVPKTKFKEKCKFTC